MAMDKKKKTTAAERHSIIEKKTAELEHSIHFKNALTSGWKEENMLCSWRGFVFVSTGEEKLCIPSKLIKIRFRPPENLGYRYEGKKFKKNNKTGNMYMDVRGNSFETGWDQNISSQDFSKAYPINLGGYRVLRIYYAIISNEMDERLYYSLVI